MGRLPSRCGAATSSCARSHAVVVAVARVGEWEGVPLVSAWVLGPNCMDSDGDALELLAEADSDAVAALLACKEARMRERGEIV